MAKKGQLTKADYLPYEEYIATLEKLRRDKMYLEELYFTVAFASALRVSDIRKLKWENVLCGHKFVLVEKKTRKNREVRFNNEVMAAIKELYELLGKPRMDAYLFPGQRNQPMGIWNINHRLKKVRDKYNLSIENFSTHSFRKTFGRYLYEASGKTQESLMMLMKILNHSNVATTYVYIGIRDDEVNDYFDKLKIRRDA